MDYLNKENLILADIQPIIDAIKSENTKEKINEAVNCFKNKWPAFTVLIKQKTEIKKASKLKYFLSQDDIEKAFLNIEFEDLFDKLNFSSLIEIDIKKVEMPIEPLLAVSFNRVDKARKEQQDEYKKSFSYQAISFFRRHPYVGVAGVMFASAAIGVAAAVGTGEALKSMGYNK